MKRFIAVNHIAVTFYYFTTLWVFILFVYPYSSYAAIKTQDEITKQFTLSSSEKAWIAKHTEIRIGVMDAWPPLDFVDKNNNPAGIGVDYITALNKRLGGILKPVSGNWSSIYKGVQEKRLDALMDITPRQKRKKDFNFTRPYLNVPHVIVGRKNSPGMANENALAGKTLALETNFGNVDYFKKNYPRVKVKQYRDTRAALGAVASGEADAYAGNRSVALFLIGEEVMTNLKVHGRVHKEDSFLSIGIRKDWPILANLLDRALADISQTETRRILSRWIGDENSYKQVNLTPKQQKWLSKHSSIRIAFDGNYPPYSFTNAQGEFVGIAVDIARELAVRTGLELQIWPEGKWQHIYSAAQQGNIDVVATMVKHSNRENWFEFTRPYISLTQYIITRKEDLPPIARREQLKGKTVALIEGYSSTEMLLTEINGIKPLYVQTLQEALEAVSIGKADATLGDLGMVNHLVAHTGIKNLNFAFIFTRSQSKQRFAVRKEWPELATILDKTLETLSYSTLTNIYAKWNIPDLVKPESGFLSVRGELTQEEKSWLQNHPRIRLASDSSWPPFESINGNGEYLGIAADYMHLVEKRLGIKFVRSPRKPWKEIVDMVKNKELDVFSCAMETKGRQQYARFSAPYISHPMIIVTQNDIGYIDGLNGLTDKTVAIEQDYASYEILSNDHPELQLHPYPNSKAAMQAVSRGEVFAYIGNIATMSFVVRDLGITNIKVSGQIPYQFELAMGVREDWPEFVPILQKTLDSISLEEKNEILKKWINVDVNEPINYTLIFQILAFVSLVFAAIIYWNRRLAREVGLRAKAEGELRSSHVTLEQRSVELVTALDQAKSATYAKSEFLSNMSHELRTPMNAVLGFAQLLTTDSKLDPENKDYANEILNAGHHLLELINEVLDLSKVEAGHLDLAMEPADIAQTVEYCITIVSTMAAQRNIAITHKIPEYTQVRADRMRLRQSLLNLISNAVKYNRQDGHVTISTEHTINNGIRILVKDTGIGIPPNQMQDLFQPFNRLHATHSDIEGTGIGLTLTKQIVELMGGSVGVDSTPNVGSTFWIELPLMKPKDFTASDLNEPPQDKNYISTDPEKQFVVLCIEDNQANIKLISKFLGQNKQLRLLIADTSRVGIGLALQYLPNLILLDIDMPEMDGYQVLNVLRKNTDLAHTPIIAMSAKAMPEDIKKGIVAGFSEYLTKPLELNQLEQTILRKLFSKTTVT